MGIPLNMFTVMFAIGRLAGWISQWKESVDNAYWTLHRPRQIYRGVGKRDYVPMDKRG
jgi:citrate synthase